MSGAEDDVTAKVRRDRVKATPRSEECGFCQDGLVPGKRDQFGFGVACDYCDGTGVVQ